MGKYLITITMPDGSQGHAWGRFDSDRTAIDAYTCAFGEASCVTAWRVS